MQTIKITEEDVDALARTARSEVGHFGKYGADTLKGGVEGVVDTILNRLAHPDYPDSVGDVVDARWQFSAIGAPGGVGSWRRLRQPGPEVLAIVRQHLTERLKGHSCTVQGAQHFLNPHFSSPKALRTWGNHVVKHHVAVWGRGKDIHYHGYAPGSGPPPAYTLSIGHRSHTFTGNGRSTSVQGSAEEMAGAGTVAGGDAGAGHTSTEESGTALVGADQDDTPAYCVEEVTEGDGGALQAVLNQRSAEGWRLRQILPGGKKLLVLFEGTEADELVHEADDHSEDEWPALTAPAIMSDTTPEGRLTRFLAGLNLRHFQPHEFLVLGGRNALKGRAQGKNSLPPEKLWPNIEPTARVLDELRTVLNVPIRLSSVYRSPEYNASLPGAATGSQHMQFCAVDFTCDDSQGPAWWAMQLKRLRDQGLFEGGIGVYPTFVHVDTRGQNAKWGPWINRVFV